VSEIKYSRYLLLDGLRGFAAFCVMLGHLSEHAGRIRIFVDLFFVLSGFVLASQVMSHPKLPARRFILKRILRFWPTITSVILFICICERIPQIRDYLGIPTHNVQNLVAAFLLLQIFYPPAEEVNGPLWSLSAEFFVNLMSILKPIRSWSNYIQMALLGATCFLTGAALNSFYNLGWLPWNYLLAFGRCWIGFYLGIFLFQMHSKKLRSFSPLRLFLGALLFLFTSVLAFENIVFYIFAAPASFLVISELILLQEDKFSKKFLNLCKYLGKLSFGIYVWHFPIFEMRIAPVILNSIGINVTQVSITTIILEILLTLLFSELSLRLVDQPINRYFKRNLNNF